MKTKKTVKEYSLDEQAKKLQAELDEAAKKELEEVTKFINEYLSKKGYDISARMILEAGKAPSVIPYIFKVQK